MKFSLDEEIQITSPDNESTYPIIFTNRKSIYMDLDYSKPLINSLLCAVDDWVSRIEYNRDLYSISKIDARENTLGGVSIKYNDKILANLILEPFVIIDQNGKKCYHASTQITIYNKCNDILGINKPKTYFINDRTFEASVIQKGERMSLIQVLDTIIPLRSESKINAISHFLKVNPSDIIFDSYKKRYMIQTPYLANFWNKPSQPLRFYKYISLNTYHNMLTSHKFRMNSIVGQSDEYESLYFSDFLCGEYENEIARFKGCLAESNILISSFTTLENNSKMWKSYGDNGNGIMLCFEPTKNDLLTPIQYMDENLPEIKSLRETISVLRNGDIRVYFSEIESMHRFIKRNEFESEKEWRLIYDFSGNLNSTIYNETNTMAYYHDFPFEGNLIADLGLALVGVRIGPSQRKNNVPLLMKETKEKFGDIKVSYDTQLYS